MLPISSPKCVAYLRISTGDQDVEKNKSSIRQLADEKAFAQVEFVEERISSKESWRQRKIADVLEALGAGDSLIVSELSRLGGSLLECMEILSIAAQKGVCVFAVKSLWQLDPGIQGKIITMAFSMAAEIERDLISRRTKEALRARKAAGQVLGRPRGVGKSKLNPFRADIETLLNNGTTKTFIAERYQTTPANLHNWLKTRGLARSQEPGRR
ncbi:recombinase family protein [Pseudomonas syringae group genomosp. 3]|uniref:Resolvase domain-containing protein n=1 Tax=Pseudomonas syringae pv. viburni TaxID=251703 RepID=A0A0Q0CUM7_9PSED|nr:recombinase family protein [Pseudomonas syringae group genomosp. 3]KPZ17386.1 Resolvase domain-containing protein [Pseudomonas syringae pv. viburni]